MALKLDGSPRPSRPARRSRWSWPGLWCIALALALCLPSSPASAQSSPPTSRLGPADYQSFQADLLTVRLQLAASRQALEKALEEKRNIEQLLSNSQAKLEKLLTNATEHSQELTSSLEQALREVVTLRQRLSESESSVAELLANLESAEKRYDQELGKAQARAKALERENCLLKVGCGLLAAGALALGIWAAVK
jgi:DNA repair exonuclease SbcCD ATPase subunit